MANSQVNLSGFALKCLLVGATYLSNEVLPDITPERHGASEAG